METCLNVWPFEVLLNKQEQQDKYLSSNITKKVGPLKLILTCVLKLNLVSCIASIKVLKAL